MGFTFGVTKGSLSPQCLVPTHLFKGLSVLLEEFPITSMQQLSMKQIYIYRYIILKYTCVNWCLSLPCCILLSILQLQYCSSTDISDLTCNMLRLHWTCFLQKGVPIIKGHNRFIRDLSLRFLSSTAAAAMIGQLDDLFKVGCLAPWRKAILMLGGLDTIHYKERRTKQERKK